MLHPVHFVYLVYLVYLECHASCVSVLHVGFSFFNWVIALRARARCKSRMESSCICVVHASAFGTEVVVGWIMVQVQWTEGLS